VDDHHVRLRAERAHFADRLYTITVAATDEAGNVQPTRAALIAERGPPRGTPNVAAFTMEHFNAIASWGIDGKGEVSHVYA